MATDNYLVVIVSASTMQPHVLTAVLALILYADANAKLVDLGKILWNHCLCHICDA